MKLLFLLPYTRAQHARAIITLPEYNIPATSSLLSDHIVLIWLKKKSNESLMYWNFRERIICRVLLLILYKSDENCLPINCPKQLDKKFRFDNNLIVKNVFFVLSQLELVLSRLHDDVCFSVDLTLFLKEKSIFLSIGLTYLPLKYAILSEIMVQPYYK